MLFVISVVCLKYQDQYVEKLIFNFLEQKMNNILFFFLFSVDILSCKLTLRKIDKNVESFLESEMIAKKPTIENTTTEHVLDEFSIKNLDDLKRIEHKLKKDKTFHLKVVRYLIFLLKLYI